jgi:hypothetical protein
VLNKDRFVQSLGLALDAGEPACEGQKDI